MPEPEQKPEEEILFGWKIPPFLLDLADRAENQKPMITMLWALTMIGAICTFIMFFNYWMFPVMIFMALNVGFFCGIMLLVMLMPPVARTIFFNNWFRHKPMA